MRGGGELPPSFQGGQVPVIIVGSQVLPRRVGVSAGCRRRWGQNWSSPSFSFPRFGEGIEYRQGNHRCRGRVLAGAGRAAVISDSWGGHRAGGRHAARAGPRGLRGRHLAVSPAAASVFSAGAGPAWGAGEQGSYRIGEFFLGRAGQAAADVIPGQLAERDRDPVQVASRTAVTHPPAGSRTQNPGHVVGVVVDLPTGFLCRASPEDCWRKRVEPSTVHRCGT